MRLLDNQTSDGSGAEQYFGGGTAYFEVTGTLDGATVALEVSRDSFNTVHEVTSLSAVDIVAVDLPICEVRATVSSAGASTNVTVRL